jgi:anaerobic magnesium-protoporphyrin IX monomethyl ester cyclase
LAHVDIVLINPGDRKQVYQGLGSALAAIEPPFWVAVIAAYLRQEGFRVAIIDANAENIAPDETAFRAAALQPLLSCVIIYSPHPSASTQRKTIADSICATLDEQRALHPSALQEGTKHKEAVDSSLRERNPIGPMFNPRIGFGCSLII